MNIYQYNSGTRLLHIVGFCKEAPLHPADGYKYFPDENSAIAYAGRQVCMCINCAKKRDELLNKTITKQKERESI